MGQIKDGLLVIQNGGAITVNFAQADAAGQASTSYGIFATEGVSQGVTNVANRYKQIGVMPKTGVGTAFDIDAIYVAVFGEPVSGSKVFVKMRPINLNTGQNGVEVSTSATVTDI